MKIVRVEYTVTGTKEDGSTVSVNKERILSDLDSTDPEHIKQVLEQEVQATEQPEKRFAIAGLISTTVNIHMGNFG